MFAFNYHRPDTLDLALGTLSANEDAKLLAGGQTLIATLKQRLASPSDLIDLAAIPGLRGIEVKADRLVVGAMTRHADVENSLVVREALPALAEVAALIGDPAVRNRGTIGGSIVNNDPSADYPAACLGLAATIVTDQRRIEADDFFAGLFETALTPDEIVLAVEFPLGGQGAYAKFPNPASRFAMAGAFVARGEMVRVAITGTGQDGVFRWTDAEAALAADFSVAALDGLSLPGDDMIADIHGTGAYRAHLAGVMTRRAVARIVERG